MSENETELKTLSRILRKALKLDPDCHGNFTVKFDFKSGNICSMGEVDSFKTVDLSKLR